MDGDNFDNNPWDAYKDLIKILTQAGYVCFTEIEDTFIVIEYCYANEEIANRYHEWLNVEEFDLIENFRDSKTSEGTDE